MGFFGKKKEAVADGPAGQATLGDGSIVDIAKSVDCIGDACPRPQLLTKKAIAAAASGDVIEVLVDNSNSMEAIPTILPEIGASHLETIKGNRRWEIYVRKD